ncbi:MAG TPA: hypothetical protein VFD55_01650 [Candidatus Angelobacter sp.]|nr:hypothetical protein [Candidatus Angelobacter sp.]
MSKLFKKPSSQSINELRGELARAHIIIALISIIAIALLMLGMDKEIIVDPKLSIICIGLLVIVLLNSISTSLALSIRKK